jgi:hypothetical protein
LKKKFQKKFINQKGQALFEMILFLPFLMFLYTIYYTAGNSISGSINQQKAVRGYFYTLVKGNSYVISLGELTRFRRDYSIKSVGFNSVGWSDHLVGSQSFAPCFKFSSLLKNNSTEECNGNERDTEGSSRFIRLFTFYGVCGPYYNMNQPNSYEINPGNQAAEKSCTLGN